MANDTDAEEYRATIRRLQEAACVELAEAGADAAAIRRALCRYFRRGYVAGLSTGELVDFFGVSGTVAEQAGYTEEEALQIMEVIGTLSDQEIQTSPL